MAVKIDDVLQANLILVGVRLINTQEEIEAFRLAVAREIATTEAGVGTDVVNRTHTLNRDRITVSANAERTTIAREYPTESDLQRFSAVARMAVECTDLNNQQLGAFGYNIELVYEPDPPEPAIQYLAKRLFPADLLRDEETKLVGGSGRMLFQKNSLSWQVALEPRFNDPNTTRVFLSLNLHRPETDLTLLSEDAINTSLRSLWSEAHSLVKQLDRITQ